MRYILIQRWRWRFCQGRRSWQSSGSCVSIIIVYCVLLRYRQAGKEKGIHGSIDLYVNSTQLGVHIGRSGGRGCSLSNSDFCLDFGFQGISARPPPDLTDVQICPKAFDGGHHTYGLIITPFISVRLTVDFH